MSSSQVAVYHFPKIYCFDHPWILHYHVFNRHHIERGVPEQIGTLLRRTLQESSFISEDFTLIEYADEKAFANYMNQFENRSLWNKGKAAKPTDFPTLKKLAPFLTTAERRLPIGLRDGTGAVYVYSYGNRNIPRFKNMFVDPGPGNTHANPQMDIAKHAPSHINKARLLHPFEGVSVIKKNYDRCASIIDMSNTDHIDAHIFTLKYVTAVGGLGLFTGTSSKSSDGRYTLFAPNQVITRFFGRRHTDEGSRNSYTQEAIEYRSDGSTVNHGLITPTADEYWRLAHFLNHDAVNPSCFMVSNSDGSIDVVVHPKYEMQVDGQTTTLEKSGGGLPPGTELTFDYGKYYEYGEDWPRVPAGKTLRDPDPPTDDEEEDEDEDEDGEAGDTEQEEDEDEDDDDYGRGDTEPEGDDDEDEDDDDDDGYANYMDGFKKGWRAFSRKGGGAAPAPAPAPAPAAAEDTSAMEVSTAVWDSLIDEFDNIDASLSS